MDTLTLLRTLSTLVGLVVFIAIIFWVYKRRDEDFYTNQDIFDEQQERFPAAAFGHSEKLPVAPKG